VVPRKIVCVETLPREATGKLVRAAADRVAFELHRGAELCASGAIAFADA
jgi:acyl-coenzyme A synthetase/AMP-(fatty) acid ligase